MSEIKDMVKDKIVKFIYYAQGELWYVTECGFEFSVPITDTGTAAMNAEDKAILFMRWIRKGLETRDLIEKQRVASETEYAELKQDLIDGC